MDHFDSHDYSDYYAQDLILRWSNEVLRQDIDFVM